MKKRPQNLNVWIVDDSTVDTFITKNALNDIDAIGNISHYNNPEKALELLVSSEGNSIYPDIILLDVSMPNMDGFEVLKHIKDIAPLIKPIIISMHDEGNYIAKCAKKGAYSYLLKNTDQEELIKVLRIVVQGKKYFSPKISEKMIDYMSENTTSEDILSSKENEVLELISKGYTTKKIAERLFVSTRTIETHRSNIIKKLKVKNTAELIKKAVKLKLI